MKQVFVAVVLMYSSVHVNGQLFSVDIPTNACSEQNILLKNNAVTNPTWVEWDFCQGDLHGDNPTVKVATSSSQLPVGSTLARASGKWYGFVCDRAGNKLIRLDFGTDLANKNPQLVNLGNLGGDLSQPQGIKIVEHQNNFYAFVNNLGSNALVRISFGTSLENSIVSSSVLLSGSGFDNGGMDVAFDGTSWVIGLTSSNQLAMFNLGSSPANNVSSSFFTSSIADVQNIGGLDFVSENGRWYAFVCGYTSATFHRLNFGSNLFSNPTAVKLNVSTPHLPYGLQVEKDDGEWMLFGATLFGNLVRLNLGFDVENNNPVYKDIGTFGLLFNTLKLSLARSKSKWIALSTRFDTGDYFLIDFPTVPCFFNKAHAANLDTITLKPLSPGTYHVSFEANDVSGTRVLTSRQVNVAALKSPAISVTNTFCLGTPSQFNISSGSSVAEVLWDFNNDWIVDSNSFSPQYTFPTAGTKQVAIQVRDSQGCLNYISKSTTVFTKPSSQFNLVNPSPICTNQSLTFTNTSTVDLGSNPDWQWSVNGTPVSVSRNLDFTFANTNPQQITLQASIPGCSTTSIQTINTLVQGPLANFTSPATACQQGTISFTNTTLGSVTGFAWSFGDGNTATTTHASNTYPNIGTYAVTLQANNAAGCQNTATKSITVYSKPQPDFSLGLPPFSCAGSASQFTDQTPAPTDSNIAAWQWAFGDPASGTSAARNPSYAYTTAGNYNVTLTATSNFGCTNSTQKTVTISPSPQAAFTNSVACVGTPTQFTDASLGSIRSRLWTIQGNSFTSAVVPFSFVGAGSYPVVLTVTANNNCISQISKNIVVPVPPSLDFSAQAACNTNPTLFAEVTAGADVPVSQTWNFAGLGIGAGATAQFTFNTTGTYTVQLQSTRQSGCVFSITKNVNIIQGPVADFTPSVDVGGPPLTVNFNNMSSGASSYLWRFGDTANTTSTQLNPSFIFTDLGVYAVKLTATNAIGCSFTASKPITVLVPNINVVLTDFNVVADLSGVLTPSVTVSNLGNLPVNQPDLVLEVESAGLIQKKLQVQILPGQTVSVPIDLRIVPRWASYLCAELVVPNNVADFDRRRCLPLGNNEVFFSPYPNPARDILNFDWVSTQPRPVTAIVFGPGGSEVLRHQFTSVASGLNRLQLITSQLPNGVYHVLYSDGAVTKSFSFAVANR